jgi:hypothetical protein
METVTVFPEFQIIWPGSEGLYAMYDAPHFVLQIARDAASEVVNNAICDKCPFNNLNMLVRNVGPKGYCTGVGGTWRADVYAPSVENGARDWSLMSQALCGIDKRQPEIEEKIEAREKENFARA